MGVTAAPRFFLCAPGADAVEWTPPDVPAPDVVPAMTEHFRDDLRYVGRVLDELRDRVRTPGLTVYVTRDVHQPLPTTGDDVVAIVLADEWQRIPPYAARVRAVFKRYGTRPSLVIDPRHGPPQLTALKMAQYARKWSKAVPNRARLWRESGRLGSRRVPVHLFPLGYFRQDDSDVAPIEDRPYDVLFYGSNLKESPQGVRARTGTVKGVGRAAMLRAAEELRTARPDLTVELVVTGAFGEDAAEREPYSQALMKAKLCLSPAGNSEETYRNYEAWRYGAVPISEGLLPLPFLRDAPYLRVRPDWRDLISVVDGALHDPAQLGELHRAALAYWDEVVSERAIGAWMAEVLDSSGHGT